MKTPAFCIRHERGCLKVLSVCDSVLGHADRLIDITSIFAALYIFLTTADTPLPSYEVISYIPFFFVLCIFSYCISLWTYDFYPHPLSEILMKNFWRSLCITTVLISYGICVTAMPALLYLYIEFYVVSGIVYLLLTKYKSYLKRKKADEAKRMIEILRNYKAAKKSKDFLNYEKSLLLAEDPCSSFSDRF